MNMWMCIALGVVMAILYQVYKTRKAKKLQQELQSKFNEQLNKDEIDKK